MNPVNFTVKYHASEVIFDKYKFNIPDQQTLRVRCEKFELEFMK